MVEDVENYRKYVHDSDCSCMEGKMRASAEIIFDNVAHDPHACHIDVMQLCNGINFQNDGTKKKHLCYM